MKHTQLIELSAALANVHVGRYLEDTLAHVLEHLCTGIQVFELNNDFHFPDLLQFERSSVFIVTRPGPAHDLYHMPEQSPNACWNLMFAMNIDIVDNREEVEVSFRWSPVFNWHHIGTHAHNHATEMRFLVYASTATMKEAREEAIQHCGGQSRIRCRVHGDCLLRQQMGSCIKCSTPQCHTPIRWRCSHGLASPTHCDTGLCFNHFRKIHADTSEGTHLSLIMAQTT
jgi:hypothetical protein